MKISREAKYLLGWFVATALLLLLAVSLSSCKTQYIKVPEVHIETVHDTLTRVDSVYNDRIRYVYTQGDTVYKIDSVFQYKFKYLDKVVEVQKIDTITQVQEVQVPVRVRNGYDKFVSWGFWLLFVAILAFTAFKIAKWYFLRK